MFNNLIESSSHAREFKRRGSFLLLTTVAYAVLFVAGGVASIYAYDAHLEDESTELGLISYVPLEPIKTVAVEPHRTTSPRNSAQITHSVRPERIDTVNPNNVPKTVGVISPIPPARPDTEIGPAIIDPASLGPPGPGNTSGTPNGTDGSSTVRDLGTAPPAPKLPPKKTVYTTSTILNGKAIYLPKPIYSQMAKQVGASGTVIVQILIDETGKVISAHAVSGHPFLMSEAQKAAYQARFSPTILGDQPVKVSGVITYNFVLQ